MHENVPLPKLSLIYFFESKFLSFEHIMRLDPKNFDSIRSMSSLHYVRLEDDEEAESLYRYALECWPHHAHTLVKSDFWNYLFVSLY